MTLKERLWTIGQAIRGKSEVKEVVKEIKAIEKGIAGSFLNFNPIGLSNQKTVSSKVLEANKGWVYRNTDAIATEVGTIEFELFTTRIVNGQIDFQQIDSHAALDALDRFNEFTDSSSGFYITESHRLLAGDAFWYVFGRGDNVKGIYTLQPDKVELQFGKVASSQRLIDGYVFRDTVDGEPIQQTYKPDEIIHFKIPNAKNPYRGYGKVEAAADAIDTDNYAIEANKQLFLRGMLGALALTTPNKLTNEQLKQMSSEFRSAYQGVENAFKVPILGSDLKPVPLQMTNRDAQFIDQQEWLRDKITSIWGNNKAAIGITDDVNRANAESSIALWKSSTVRAEMKAICDTLNEFFIPRFGDNLILGFKDPVGEDEMVQIEKATKLKDSDVISLNEAREILDYEPVEGGEEMSFQRSERQAQQNAEQFANLPKSLKYVSIKKHLRKSGVFKALDKERKLLEIARPIAEKVVKQRKRKNGEPPREHILFTNEKVWTFHQKQIHLVEAKEKIFENKLIQYIDFLVEKALANLPEEVAAMQQKQLLPEEELIVRAQFDFAPILSDVAVAMGQEALKLIEDDSIYVPTNLRPSIEANVRKFALSMVETDRDKMIDIIAQGIAEGRSIPQIRKQITDTFDEYKKVQANRITRTEVIRASNMGAIDAWEESGVVTGKQWLTAMDDRVDPLCAYMNGKIINLRGKYFNRGETLEVGDAKTNFDYGSIKEPPLHPNCRCTLLPILRGENAFDADEYLKVKGLETDKAELESKIDKRTKEYKQLKERNLELEQYVKELEGLLDEPSEDS